VVAEVSKMNALLGTISIQHVLFGDIERVRLVLRRKWARANRVISIHTQLQSQRILAIASDRAIQESGQ
jgi:hypothetical protein